MPILEKEKLKEIMPSQYGASDSKEKATEEEPQKNKPIFQDAKKPKKKDKACGKNCKYAYGSNACISCVEFK